MGYRVGVTVAGVRSAFLDEADFEPSGKRPGLYLVAAAIVDPAGLQLTEELLQFLLRPEDVDQKGHARLHISRTVDRRRRSELVATLGSLRYTRFVVGWTAGYRSPKERERARALVLWELLPFLAGKEQVSAVTIEEREEKTLRAADARTVGRLRDSGALAGEMAFVQVPASARPALWLADAAAAAWRRSFAEGKENWSRWYAPHTTLLEVPYSARQTPSRAPG